MGAALYVCRGCGREAADAVADLEAMHAGGFLSCCPDREVVQVGPCLFPQPYLIPLRADHLCSGGIRGIGDVREGFEVDAYLFGVRGLDAGDLPYGGLVTRRVAGMTGIWDSVGRV